MAGRSVRAAVSVLDAEGVLYALIGAMAMASHGAPRNTHDADLLVTSPRVLDERFWEPAARVVRVEVRRGEEDDPLRGLVRLGTERSRCPVDIVVPRGDWLEGVIQRAVASRRSGIVDGVALPLVTLEDLVLLKADAAGTIDLLDIQLLLETWPERREALLAYVDERLDLLDDYGAGRWRQFVRPP